MRRRSGVLLVAAAAVLGTLLGAVVLPDRETTAEGRPVSSTSASPSPPGATTEPSPAGSSSGPPEGSTGSGSAQGPVGREHLLTAADFRAVGLDLAPERSDLRAELVVCAEHETLDDVASSGPPVQQFWSAGSVGATEQAIAARDEEEAAGIVRQVLDRLEDCQRAPRGHWVYGPTHDERLGAEVTASWLGTVDGRLNTSGRAPSGEQITAGLAVLRNGSHVAVLDVSWCQSAGDEAACVVAGDAAAGQLADLSRVAAGRLG